MPTAPLRGVGAVGLVTDILPHDLPINAWNEARNVRFKEGKVSRYSAFKYYDETYMYSKTPVSVLDGAKGHAEGVVVTVFNDGTMEQNQNGTVTDVTPPGTLGTSSDKSTSCNLGSVTYVNRPTDVPVFRYFPTTSNFAPIPGWSANDRCKILRSYKDFLIALNVSKTGVTYPSMVKWSDAAQVGAPPSSWASTDPSLGGENILNDCDGQIRDGLALAESFIIYAETQTYRMDYIGKPFIFRTMKIFDDVGVISANCVENVESKHYVFGENDIYVHDGLSKVSIAHDKVRDRVYSEIDMDKKEVCFTYHDEVHSEIAFCFPSVANDAPWDVRDIDGCNRAAVFNYRDNTWTFVDLPSLIDATVTNQVKGTNWEELGTWEAEASQWNSFDGTRPRHTLTLSAGNSALTIPATIYFLDTIGSGRLPNPLAPDILWAGYAERSHIDLDEMQVDLVGRKQVKRIIPQIRTTDPDERVTINVGYNATPNTATIWGQPMTFDPWNDYKYDTRVNHRYLSFRIEFPAGVHGEFSGYDAEIVLVAGR